MPTAKKLPSGTWRVLVYSHTEYVDGKPKKKLKSFTGATKKEAEYKASLFQMQIKDKACHNITLEDALLGYIDSKDGVLSPSTIRGYKQIQRTYLLDLQKKNLPSITNLDVQIALNAERKSRQLSPKTMRNIVGLLSAAIGLYREDFILKVTLPEKERYDYHIPSQTDIMNLLARTEGTDLHTAILLAACLGLRRGEICALRWNDFDWDTKTVKINKAAVLTAEDTWQTKNPKSYAGNRVLSISDGLIKELEKIKSTGKVIEATPTQISHRFIRAVKSAGLEHFRFHDLRHFNASLMLAEGIPDKYAMERMGHATPSILKSVYQHTENEKRTEINYVMNGCIDRFLQKG